MSKQKTDNETKLLMLFFFLNDDGLYFFEACHENAAKKAGKEK